MIIKKNIATGIVFIVIGVWFYLALSTFKIEEGTNPKRIIIKEGIVRTEDEIARALAEEIGFDLEGAYKVGYTPRDVIEYLIEEPHKLPVTFHEGRFYTGRVTAPYIFPFAVCVIFICVGIGIIIFTGIRKKS